MEAFLRLVTRQNCHETRGNSKLRLRKACVNQDSLSDILTKLIVRKPSMRRPISGRNIFFSTMFVAMWGPFILLFNVYDGLFFRAAKRPVREADHWHPSSTKIENERSYTSTLKSFYGLHSVLTHIYLKSISLEVRR